MYMNQLKVFMANRYSTLAGALLILSGCGDTTPGMGLASTARTGPGFFSGLLPRGAPDAPARPLTRAALARGEIALVAPHGWCIEPQSLSNKGRGSFAMLAGCNALTEGQTGPRVPRGVLTVTVSAQREDGTLTATEALGAAAHNGDVLDQDLRDGVALVHLRPAAAASDAGLGDPHWRAVFVHGGRAVTLAAYGPRGGDLSRRPGADLLMQLVRGIRGNSPGFGA